MAQWKKIVVGVDGSDYSRSALRWAVDEARQRGAEVEAVSAFATLPAIMPPPLGASPSSGDVPPNEQAERVLAEVVSDVVEDGSDVAVRTETQEGNPAKVLIDRSADADVVVVGSRGHGGFTGMLLGSVSQHVVAHARCTVVVVR